MTPFFNKDLLPKEPGMHKLFGNQFGSAIHLTLASIAQNSDSFMVVITPDVLTAQKLEQELPFFLSNENQTQIPIITFPDWETLPYDSFSPHQDIISERLKTLYRLPSLKKGLLIVPISTFVQRVCPTDYLTQYVFHMKVGETLNLEHLKNRLVESGYRMCSEVETHGDVAVRGSILDLFPMGSQTPFRIDLFDNEIDSIRTFDPETQRSIDKVNQIELLPAREFPFTEEAIKRFRTEWRENFEGDPKQCPLYVDVSEGLMAAGLEYYLPLFFEKTATLFDFLPTNTLMVRINDLQKPIEENWQYIKGRYEQYRHDRLRPILKPEALYLPVEAFYAHLKHFPEVRFQSDEIEEGQKNRFNFPIKRLPNLAVEARQEKPFHAIEAFIKEFKGRILFCAESAGRREIIKELFNKIGINPIEISQLNEFVRSSIQYGIAIAPLEQGGIVEFPSQNWIAIISESDLFGQRVMQRRRRKAKATDFENEVQNLTELSEGAPVVHVDYGVGRYRGLTYLTLSGHEGEFVTLEYAGGDKLYVPVSSLQLISRYSGGDLESAPLHRLGGPEWSKEKKRVLEQVRDVAADLLELYAKRAAKKGYAFPKPDEHYDAFCALFPFEETPDQAIAIEAVIDDLSTPKSMDRLVCGDVGFGKTEVALRASFLVVHNGKQVAILVPTTLLAQQHYQTFCDRFAGFPVRIEMLSRFKTKKEQEQIIEQLESGQVDIVIGTHKIIQKGMRFKNLGLLIIDEEHRFGVRQKEALKAFRAEVDILTLTATPIPRTLNMAFANIRDLSIIATPPARRLSIKTFVRERRTDLIQEAILRELHRGGQVYFVHNTVESIQRIGRELEELVPSARIAVAHGQMREVELEQIMSDFYHRRFNVLVCTTIIETGIDIPTANTILIDRADKFGLAQLHQLRGRVGRSHHQAYAYCLTPPPKLITSDAVKRLEAISAFEDLGVGFTLATHDLEIRGAGALLGEEQSGNIHTVGFELYMELLNKAVKILKRVNKENKESAKIGSRENKGLSDNLDDLSFKRGIEIDLQIPSFIPENYLPDVHSRLVLYKRISNAKNMDALEELMSEMIDRFGMMPSQIKNLFKISELKLLVDPLGIVKVDAGPNSGRIEFSDKPNVNPDQIIQMIQKEPKRYKLEGSKRIKFIEEMSDAEKRIQAVKDIISRLM